ncbi:MAG TPA: YidC/Oxa1 family membrane protein insertase [Candidatus Saccharimonadales bacterium]|nr:YidC/Oxa1 family membrane protein insertase [Candidatus Saccharimonadales bacterium]
MFTTLIVQPIFNLLVLIYALLPGHNFGLAIILFTVLVRLLLWPLVKKQLHHAKAMRALQPELKRIKQAAKGNRQKESLLVMELYKERQINPFSSIGLLLLQVPILLGLYSGLTRLVNDPQTLINFTYPFISNLSWMKELAADIGKFDSSLFGVVDLIRPALQDGRVYWPAMVLVLGSVAAQYFQSKQLLPTDKDARSLRSILRDAQTGKTADQAEVSAAISRGTIYFIPLLIFVFTISIASALSLYWLVSGVVAILQQRAVLEQDETELEAIADKAAAKPIIEGEVVTRPAKNRRRQGSKVKKRKKK